MPYIAVNTTQKLSDDKKEKVKTELGRLITHIPTKTEAGLLVDFSDGRAMYMAGKNVEGAFIELRLLNKFEFEPKKKFTEEVFEMLSRELGVKKENMYLNILEFNEWGARGTFS